METRIIEGGEGVDDEDTPRRERKTAYYIVQKPLAFKSKSELEKYLNTHGGLTNDAQILRGVPVVAEPKQVFKLN